MRTTQQTIDHSRRDQHPYALRREAGCWQLTFEGRHATFPHEQGALYVAWLLLHPPQKPIHALTLALEARTLSGPTRGAAEVIQERFLGLDQAEIVRTLRRRERELEAVLEDRLAIEPVKAEALRELEAIYDFRRKNPWRSRDCVQKCAHAVSRTIRCLHARLASALDSEGKPDPVLQTFAQHLNEYLLFPSDGGGIPGRQRVGAALPGWFTYEPPPGVVWSVEGGRASPRAQTSQDHTRNQGSPGRSPSQVDSESSPRRPAAVGYLSRFLCVGFALALLCTGCVGPRPLKGGKAVTTHKPGGVVEQTLVQGENPSQATKQDQETVKVRTYTVPAGSRVEQSPMWEGERPREPKHLGKEEIRAREDARPPDRQQPSSAFVLSAPMPVVEREETRARTELGAAQKDTARELGAKLSSLKGIVWVGVGLFVFGLASLVWPPLKVIIGSVTTSAALMLGGVALMVLPSMIVGNELLILGAVGLGVGGWFLAHRHGKLRGQVAASAGGQTLGSNQSSVASNQSSVASGQ